MAENIFMYVGLLDVGVNVCVCGCMVVAVVVCVCLQHAYGSCYLLYKAE